MSRHAGWLFGILWEQHCPRLRAQKGAAQCWGTLQREESLQHRSPRGALPRLSVPGCRLCPTWTAVFWVFVCLVLLLLLFLISMSAL